MTIDLMRKMGSEHMIGTYRSDTPFSYTMNKYFSHLKILPVEWQIVEITHIWTWYHHGGEVPNTTFISYDESKDDIHYMFNRQVKCLYLMGPIMYRIYR